MTIDEHRYTSTACHHGMHDRCRQICKYCTAFCLCPCHYEREERWSR